MKTTGLLVLWLLGSIAAIAISWTGVSLVDDELVDPAPATNLPDAEVVELVLPRAQPSTSTTVAATTTTTTEHAVTTAAPVPLGSVDPAPVGIAIETAEDVRPEPGAVDAPGPAVPPAPTTTQPAVTSTLQTAPSLQVTNERQPGPVVTVPVPTTSPTVTSPPAPAPTTSTSTSTTQAPAPAQTLTFHLIGGSTAVSFSPSAVTVLWASPNPGFGVELYYEGSGMRAEFRADHHRSRIDVWWSGGPQHLIDEDENDRGGNGGGGDGAQESGNGDLTADFFSVQSPPTTELDRSGGEHDGDDDDHDDEDNSGPGNARDRRDRDGD